MKILIVNYEFPPIGGGGGRISYEIAKRLRDKLEISVLTCYYPKKNIYPEEIESIINEFPFVAESLVMEKGDQLVAKVYLNYEEIDKEFRIQKLGEPKAREIITKIFADLLVQINMRVNTFSRINKIFEQPEPFEKTPTQKIKRYLYVE